MAPLKGAAQPPVRDWHSCVGTGPCTKCSWRWGRTLGRSKHGCPSVPPSLVFQPNQGPGQGGSKKDLKKRSKDLNSTENPIWRNRWEARCLLSNSFDTMPATSMKPEARPHHLRGPTMRKMCLQHPRGCRPRHLVRFHDPHHHLLGTGERTCPTA